MAASSLFFLSFLLFISSATCFNITKILDTYPDFSTFNKYLTETKLADEINNRQTITVLTVANGAMGGVQGSPDTLKATMSLHVILDYYDDAKLSKLAKGTAKLTTLYQSTGDATHEQGFLNVTHMKDGGVAFGSAVKGSPLNSKLVKKVVAQPYNISVLQVSAPITVDGLHPGAPNKAPSPPPADSPVEGPSNSPDKAPSPSPSTSDAPASDSPSSSPAPAEGPAADAPADGPPEADKSAGARVSVGTFVGVVMVGISSWVAL